MNLYLRDKEKYQEGVDYGIKAGHALANQELQAERERSQKLQKTLKSIATKFKIPVEELLEQQPHDNTPKA